MRRGRSRRASRAGQRVSRAGAVSRSPPECSRPHGRSEAPVHQTVGRPPSASSNGGRRLDSRRAAPEHGGGLPSCDDASRAPPDAGRNPSHHLAAGALVLFQLDESRPTTDDTDELMDQGLVGGLWEVPRRHDDAPSQRRGARRLLDVRAQILSVGHREGNRRSIQPQHIAARCRRSRLVTRARSSHLTFTPMRVDARDPAARVDSRMELLGGHSEHHDF